LKTITLLLAAHLLFAPMVLAQHNNDLKGNFPFNETIHVIFQTNPPVNGACGATLSGPVTEAIITDTGIWSFDGKGNVTINDSGIFINPNPPTDASQVTPEGALCKGTYNVLDKSTVDFHYNCTTDNFATSFQVHTTGRITKSNILVEAWTNPGPPPSLPVTPLVLGTGNTALACNYIGENTTISRTDN